MLPADQASNYDQLKAALHKRYQLFADGFKRRFRTAKPESGETPTQFLTRIGNYLQRWIELANAKKSFDGLKTLMIQEQYLSVCPKEMAMHLKENKPKSIQEIGEKAENYVEAHATDIVFGIDPRSSNIRSLRPETRQYHNCGKVVSRNSDDEGRSGLTYPVRIPTNRLNCGKKIGKEKQENLLPLRGLSPGDRR